MQRIVLTGGPAAGKTAVLDVLRKHLAGEVVVLPESATMLFSGGFPRPSDATGKRLVQRAIWQVQVSLEELFQQEHPDRPHLCDRGTLDGAAYWPGGPERFLASMGTTLASEYRRYDAVLFLETSAYSDAQYPSDNPVRIESPAQARALDARLQEVWKGHPGFHLIGHQANFYEKVALVLIELHRVLGVGNAVSQRLARSVTGSGTARRRKGRRRG
jgi:predicted ATPase